MVFHSASITIYLVHAPLDGHLSVSSFGKPHFYRDFSADSTLLLAVALVQLFKGIWGNKTRWDAATKDSFSIISFIVATNINQILKSEKQRGLPVSSPAWKAPWKWLLS